MITYKNSYAVGDKFYADIFAKRADKIFVDDLANGSTLRVIDENVDVDVLYYFDQEDGRFRHGSKALQGYLSVLPNTTFTIQDTGGTNRQRFADVRNFTVKTTYYFDVEVSDSAETFQLAGEKDESGNMVFTVPEIGQIVANVAESEAYGEPGMYIVSPMLDMMVGAEISIKIYVDAFGMMDFYGR